MIKLEYPNDSINNAIFYIAPEESPLVFFTLTQAQRTVLAFSGRSEEIINYFYLLNNKKSKREVRHEWHADVLEPVK